MREHGGDIDGAQCRHGGAPADWIDLSTGINRVSYPVPALPAEAWQALPTRAAMARLCAAAQAAYGTGWAVLPLAGAQAAIQMMPLPGPRGTAAILSPTYNEHAGAFTQAGWTLREDSSLEALKGADCAVVVNPNNPDGRRHPPEALRDLAGHVGRLIVDESFADVATELSLLPGPSRRGLFVMRSFGKFYGLAGLRLGFLLGDPAELEPFSAMAGPWPVSGLAIETACAAFADTGWAEATRRRLADDAQRLDRLALARGWATCGGCDLYRLYDVGDALAAQDHLARHRIWSRRFGYAPRWLRLGLPGSPAEWARLEQAMAA
ncbi:MAG: threonine-phosphate decarboxylase CobD [Paracoccaceae bacterium]